MPLGMIGGQLPQLDTSIGSPLQVPAQASQPAPKKKGGMFGSGVAEMIVAALNGYLASRGNPVGMANMQMLQQRHRQAAEEQQYQQHRTDSFEDWVKQQAYKAANPEAPDPTAFQKDYSWYQQNLPGMAEQFAKAHADSGGSPFGRMFTDPTNGQQYMLPSQGGPQVGAVVDDPRKGGPASPAPGGFPGSR